MLSPDMHRPLHRAGGCPRFGDQRIRVRRIRIALIEISEETESLEFADDGKQNHRGGDQEENENQEKRASVEIGDHADEGDQRIDRSRKTDRRKKNGRGAKNLRRTGEARDRNGTINNQLDRGEDGNADTVDGRHLGRANAEKLSHDRLGHGEVPMPFPQTIALHAMASEDPPRIEKVESCFNDNGADR